MIILTKKRILHIIGIIAIFIFAYTYVGYNVTNNNKEKNNVIQTTALPVNSKVIVLDAGHGIPDERC